MLMICDFVCVNLVNLDADVLYYSIPIPCRISNTFGNTNRHFWFHTVLLR